MIKFTDEFMSRIEGRIPNEYIRIIMGELSDMLTRYNVEPVCTDIELYEGYLPECFKAFFVTKKIEGKSDKTLALYMLRLKEFFYVIRKPIETITSNDVKAYLYNYQKARNVSNRTLDSVRSVLSSFFSWASAEGYLEKNIMISVKPIKYRRKQRGSLDDYELEKLRSACETIRDEALVEFLYSTGCRVSELVNVNKEDVNIKDGEVTLIGKGDKERKSYLTAHASLALQEYLKSRDDDNNALFVSKVKPHNRLKKGAIEKIIGELGVKAGIEKKVYPHLIRHTTATMGLQHGMDVTEIQKMLGHANIETTMIYAEVNQNDVKTSHKKYII